MVKINLIHSCALALAVFFMGTTANAQTVWGVGAAVGTADAEFSTPFTQATTFSAGDNATTWTALTVNESDGAVLPGNAYWERNLTGLSSGAFATNMTPATSASVANGVALFDSDFKDNGGSSTGIGTGISPADHRGELISPRMDLTAAMNNAIVIQFYSYYRLFQIAELSVAVSTDDGATWSTPADILGLQPVAVNSDVEGTIRALFPSSVTSVANLTQCRIKFVFDGEYYYSILDDISIEVAPDYDIALGGPEPGNNTVGGGVDNAKIGSNRYNALDNIVHANDLREFLWGSRGTNLGAIDMVPADSASIHISIDFEDPISGAITTGVYTDVMYYDSLAAGDIVGEIQVDYLDDINFISTHGAGDYNVTYWMDHKNPDGNASNDTLRHTFTVTDPSLPFTNYLSKCRIGNDGGVFAARSIFPGGGPFASWEYGSVFFFPRGGMDTVTIDSISFRYRLTGGFSGAANQTMFCNVYEMDPSTGTLDDGALLTQIGIGTISLTGLGTTVAAGDFGLTTVSGFIDATGSGSAMPGLKDNGFYYVSILTNPSLTGGVASFDADDVPWIGADAINFSLNATITRPDSVINISPINIVDAAGTSTWNWVGFGADLAPSLGLYLGIKPMNPVSVSTVYASEGGSLSVYPNPANDVINFDFEVEEASDVMYILTDLTGRVLDVVQSNNVTVETQSMDISKLPAGMYLLTAKCGEKTWTQKVARQ